ncbi:MAG: HYR domain-containing protein, partial [Saprospiraceae bacterium]|nr:HYR domain-containing protein [Saprospiraceae bacterium]
GNNFSSNGTNVRHNPIGLEFIGDVLNTNTGTTYCSIQSAIDAAATLSGHTLAVSAASYTENVDAATGGKDIALAPGNSPGCVTITGDMTLNSGDALDMEIDGTTACTGYDQFTVNGAVTLGGATLNLTITHTFAHNEQVTLIVNDGVDAVSGQFAQGNFITVSGVEYYINYAGGTGNDVVLMRLCGDVCGGTVNITSATVTLSTQAQVIAFKNASGCKYTKITGNLVLDGNGNAAAAGDAAGTDPITDLCNLQELVEVTGSVTIRDFNVAGNPTTLADLANLTTIGTSLTIGTAATDNNGSFTSIQLNGVTNIGDASAVNIQNNPNATAVELKNLAGQVGATTISNNAALNTIDVGSLGAGWSTGGANSVNIQNNLTLDAVDMSKLTSTGGDVTLNCSGVTGSPDLATVNFAGLVTVGDALTLDNNNINLSGATIDLTSLVTVGGDGSGSMNISDIAAGTLDLKNLVTVNGTITIGNNDNGLTNVEFEDLTTVLTDMTITGNNDLVAVTDAGTTPGFTVGQDLNVETNLSTTLATIDLQGLTSVARDISMDDNNTTTAGALVSLPELTSVGRDLIIGQIANWIYAPNLLTVTRNVNISDNNALCDLNLSGLQTVGGYLLLADNYDACGSATISMDALTTVGDNLPLATSDYLSISGNNTMPSLSFPALTAVNGTGAGSNRSVEFIDNDAATSLSFDVLTTVPGEIYVNGNALLNSVSFDDLVTVGEDLRFVTNPALATISFPALTTVTAAMEINDNDALTTLDAAFPSLTTIGTTLAVTGNAALGTCCIIPCQLTSINGVAGPFTPAVNTNPSGVTISTNKSFASGGRCVNRTGPNDSGFNVAKADCTPVVSNQATSICTEVAMNYSLGALVPGDGDTYIYTVVSSDEPNVPAGPDRGTYSADNITDTYVNNTGSAVTITYTVTPKNFDGCTGTPFDVVVTVNPKPIVTLNLLDDLCYVTGTAYLTDDANTLYSGNYSTGTYSGPGVSPSGADWIFDAAAAGGMAGSPYTITYEYTDGNGCTNTATDLMTVYDTEVELYVDGPSSVECKTNATFEIKADNFTDLISLGTLSVSWDIAKWQYVSATEETIPGGTADLNTTSSASGYVDYDFNSTGSGITLPNGSTLLTLVLKPIACGMSTDIAVGAAGPGLEAISDELEVINVNTTDFPVDQEDTQDPTPTCPDPIVVNSSEGEDDVPADCGAEVTFAATATDVCDASPDISYSKNPGTIFPVGVTTVTVTATDDCSNDSDCQFTVTVMDNESTAAPATLTLCSTTAGGTTADFDLTDADATVSAGNGWPTTVTYHASLSDANNDVNALSSPYTSANGTVYARVENSASALCYATSEVTLVVNTTPSAGSITSGNRLICTGGDPSGFTATAVAGVTYQWQYSQDNGTTWTPATGGGGIAGQNYNIPGGGVPDPEVNTLYRRQVTSTGNGCTNVSNTVTVYVNTVDLGTLTALSPQTICVGDPVVMLDMTTPVTTTGVMTTVSYQWQESANGTSGWTDISGANSEDYTPTGLTATRYFRRIVTVDADGTAQSTTPATVSCSATPATWQAVVHVNAINAGTINMATAANHQTICEGGDAAVFVAPAATAPAGAAISYLWEYRAKGSSDPWVAALGGAGVNDVEDYNAPAGSLTFDAEFRRTVTSVLNTVSCTAYTTNNPTVDINEITDPGMITYGDDPDFTVCSGTIPAGFAGTTGAADGTITYQWRSSITISTDPLTSNVGGGAGQNLPTPPALTADIWYGRRLTSTLNGVACTAFSNIIGLTEDPLPANPTVTPGGVQSFCSNSDEDVTYTITLNVDDDEVEWSFDDFATAPAGSTNATGPQTITVPAPTPNPPAFVTTTVSFRSKHAGTECVSTGVDRSVRFYPPATVDAGTVDNICYNATTPALGGVIGGGATTATWTSSVVGGTFLPNATTLDATYTPPTNYSGPITLTLTTNDPAGPCGSVNDNVMFTVYGPLQTSIAGASNVCLDGDILLTGTVTGGSGSGLTHTWTVTPGTGNATLSDETTDTPTLTGTAAGTVTVTYEVTDDANCQMLTTGMKVITVDAPPTLTACLSDQLPVTEPGQCDAELMWTHPNVVGLAASCGPATLEVDYDLGDGWEIITPATTASETFPLGTSTVKYRLKDVNGNIVDDCEFDVTVSDNQAPVITDCPVTRNISGCSTDDISGPAFAVSGTSTYAEFSDATNQGVATDNCPSANFVVTYADVASGTCTIVVTRTWTIKDAGNNMTSCAQTINVNDDTAPSLTGAAYSQSGTINGCKPTQAAAEAMFDEAKAIMGYTDNCGGVVTATRTGTVVSGTDCTWNVEHTYTVTDGCGNDLPDQEYDEDGADDTAPSLTGAAYSQSGTINGCKPTQAAAEAMFDEAKAIMGYTDNCGGVVTATRTGTVVSGTDCTWNVEHTYTVKDACLNELPGQKYDEDGGDDTAPSLTAAAYAQSGTIDGCKPTQSAAEAMFDNAKAIMGYTDNCGGVVTATRTATVVTG